jgi:HEAT repeat protein
MRNFNLVSFFIGAAVASVFWWVLYFAQPLLKQLVAATAKRRQERELQASTGIEGTLRRIVYKHAQGMHLAASLFALNEIAEAPHLLAPPPNVMPGAPHHHSDVVEQALPYLPAWPEMASVFNAPTLTIPEALSGGRNLIITGQPGAGKTVALAYLASQIANRTPEAESLRESVPFLLHVADLGLPLTNTQKPEDLLKPISEAISEKVPVFEQSRIPNFVLYAFQNGRALLLLDDVDELPQAAIQEVTAYLRLLLKAYPKARIVTTGALEYMDGLLALGFVPLALMPWNKSQQTRFLQRWSELWQRYVATEAWAQTAPPVDGLLLNRWLANDNATLSPLEYTLKIWAAYAGDARGARAVDAIEAHLRRLTPQNTPAEALHVLGTQASLNGTSVFDSKRAKEWTKSFELAEPVQAALPTGETPPFAFDDAFNGESLPAETGAAATEAVSGASVAEPVTAAQKGQKKNTGQLLQTTRASLIGQLTASGILSAHTNNQLRFTHPVFMGYLASKGLSNPGANIPETLLQQPAWSGQTLCLRYLCILSDATPLISSLMTQEDPLLARPKLAAARLLRDAPRSAAWRGTVMAELVKLLQNNDQPLGLRGQAIAAFALSGDPSAAALFRQLMQVPSNDLRQLAALGAGMLADPKAVDALAGIITQSTGPARHAACLSLVQIGSPSALEAVATVLMRADEPMRIAAAEALANHPVEGHETLRDGITSEDILVRRAIVYGLARVHEPWADQLLEKTQTEDNQWAVRNVAVEMMDARQHPDPSIPQQLTPPAETPWLIEFAGKNGMGVTPGQPATDIFLLALKSDDEDARLAALNYLRYTPNEGVIAALYQQYFGGNTQTKETVYQVLSDIAYGGTALPHPMQFGLG